MSKLIRIERKKYIIFPNNHLIESERHVLTNEKFFKLIHNNKTDVIIESNGVWYVEEFIDLFLQCFETNSILYQYLLNDLLEEERIIKKKIIENIFVFNEFYKLNIGVEDLFNVIKEIIINLAKNEHLID